MRYTVLLPLILAGTLSAYASADTKTPPPAAATLAPVKDILPRPIDASLDEAIASVMQRSHYSNRSLDDGFSLQIFNQYLQDLDQYHSYFLQSDIDGFAADRDKLDDAIRNGDLKPAYGIYNVFLKRVDERIQYALSLLKREPDLTVKESYVYDRSKAPWAKDKAELDDLWRKRVKNDVISLLLTGKTWPQVSDTLQQRYRNFAKRDRQVMPEDVFSQFMNAYVHSVDPHTDYFSPTQYKEFQIQISIKLQGIGASLVTDGDYTRVDHLLPGGPAARDPQKQLRADDRITGVAQGEKGEMEDVIGMRLTDVVSKIRGTPGTVVRLQVLPAGAAPGSPEKLVQYTRDDIKLEAQAAKQKVIDVTRGDKSYKIGVITLPGFYEDDDARMHGDKDYTSTTHDVRRLLGELQAQHVDGIVMDLRNNGGGSLKQALDLTGLFIPDGPVVQIRRQDGRVMVDDEDEDTGVVYSGPLTVLVNRFTASASEIFAAAIQDYHRGPVVGSTTYGKGTVQQVADLSPFVSSDSDAGQLKLTTNKYYRVTGSSTQNKGVIPDITLPALVDPADFGESANPSALTWDEITPARFTPLSSGLSQALPKLLDQHTERTAKDADWKLFMDALQDYNAQRAQTSLSLVLAEREKQRAEDDAKRLGFANAWRKLKGLPPAATLEEAFKAPKGSAAAEGNDSDASNPLQPDVLLDETAAIVADMSAAGLFQGSSGPALADRTHS
jgi:carboxyl-terminal processing protease